MGSARARARRHVQDEMRNKMKNKAQGAGQNHTHGAERGGQKKKRKRLEMKVRAVERAAKDSEPARKKSPPLGEGELSVLLLGEGDFSFAAALAMSWGECNKLTATAFAAEAMTLTMEGAEDNIEMVKAFGGSVLHRVDATALHTCQALHGRKCQAGFERIVFNFPVGSGNVGSSCSSYQDPKQREGRSFGAVADTQALLRQLFKSALAGKLLAASGQIHITLRPADATAWDIVTLAKIAGLGVTSCGNFDPTKFHGYHSPYGTVPAVTYVLAVPPRHVTEAEEKTAKIAAAAKAHAGLRLGPTGQSYTEAWKQRHQKSKK